MDAIAKLKTFFDTEGSYEAWTFYGLHSATHEGLTCYAWPDVLAYNRAIPFVFQCDLDDMLSGYIRGMKEANEVVNELRELARDFTA